MRFQVFLSMMLGETAVACRANMARMFTRCDRRGDRSVPAIAATIASYRHKAFAQSASHLMLIRCIQPV